MRMRDCVNIINVNETRETKHFPTEKRNPLMIEFYLIIFLKQKSSEITNIFIDLAILNEV